MSWWVWLLIGWAVLATVGAFWTGATAAKARRRERAARAHQYSEAIEQEWRAAA